MSSKWLRGVILTALAWGCNAKEDDSQANNPSSTKAEESKSSSSDADTTSSPTSKQDQAADANYYEVSIPRPPKLCAEEGYRYLLDAYFLPECGGCHYPNNRYGVTPFAVANDFATSFSTMTTVTDTAKVREAVHGNAFCKQCKLMPNDPLNIDINFWLDHPTDCTAL